MFRKIFDHFEEVLGAFTVALMVSISFANVVTRYLSTSFREYLGIELPSMAFTEEITISMFVWITLLGVSIAFRKNANLAVTLFYDYSPRSVRKIFHFAAALLCVVFFGLLVWLGGTQVLDEFELGVTTDALAIPAWIYSAGIPVFSALIIIRILQGAINTSRSDSY